MPDIVIMNWDASRIAAQQKVIYGTLALHWVQLWRLLAGLEDTPWAIQVRLRLSQTSYQSKRMWTSTERSLDFSRTTSVQQSLPLPRSTSRRTGKAAKLSSDMLVLFFWSQHSTLNSLKIADLLVVYFKPIFLFYWHEYFNQEGYPYILPCLSSTNRVCCILVDLIPLYMTYKGTQYMLMNESLKRIWPYIAIW